MRGRHWNYYSFYCKTTSSCLPLIPSSLHWRFFFLSAQWQEMGTKAVVQHSERIVNVIMWLRSNRWSHSDSRSCINRFIFLEAAQRSFFVCFTESYHQPFSALVVGIGAGAVWRPPPLCGRHQRTWLTPGAAGQLLVCCCVLQFGVQRVAVAKGKCLCLSFYLILFAHPFLDSVIGNIPNTTS